MKKNSSNSVLIKFVIKAVITTVISLMLFSYISSLIIYKLDLSLDLAKIISVIIVAFTSAVIAFVSVYGLKNNGVLMGIISQLLLILYSLFNVLFNGTGWLLFTLKFIMILLVSSLVGYIVARKGKRYKI